VQLRDISARALEKCCQYFYYKLRYSNVPSKSIPQFDVPPELALELLMASNYLDM
jgi:transcription elongation factor B subunit 1